MVFISVSSLTDIEWATINTLTDQHVTLANYNALLVILDARETMSGARDRLRYYFLAHGVEIAVSSSGKSNIFLGASLE